MTILRNSFEGGTNGANISTTNSGGASGAALTNIVVSNSPVNTGSPSITYVNSPVIEGSLAARITQQSTATYIRWDDTQVGNRFVVRRGIYLTANPTANNSTIIQVRSSAGVVAQVSISIDGTIRILNSSTSVPASASPALSLNTIYWIEMAMTKETGTGTTDDGVIELLITNNSGAVFHTYTFTGANTGIADVTQYRFGQPAGAAWSTYDYIDGIAAGPLDTGWIGSLTLSPNQNVSASSNVSVGISSIIGTPTAYNWTFDYPTSGAPALSGASTATASFTAGSVSNLYILRCTVTYSGGGTSFATTEVRVPVAGTSDARIISANGTGVGAWSRVSAATDGEALSDAVDGTYVESDDLTSTPQTKKVRWRPSNARATAEIILKLWSTTGTPTATVKLYEGGIVRQAWALTDASPSASTLTTTPTNYTFTLLSGTVSAIEDWGNLYLELSVVA